MKHLTTILCSGVMVFGLTACDDEPYRPILDGRADENYERDLAECRNLSLQREKESGAKTGAIIGAVIGAIDGSEDNGDRGDILEGAVIGAGIGALAGDVEASAKVEAQRESIVFNCMRGRGHKVVG